MIRQSAEFAINEPVSGARASVDGFVPSSEALQTQKMEAVGQLAGGVAHDLSNLMTAMFGWLEIASSQLPPDHPARESLKMVDRAARQAVGLTRSLLTFSHRTHVKKTRIQLNEVIRETARLLSRLLPASIELRTTVDPEPTWIEGDATQIQQVLMNLAVNARDAICGGGVIEIMLESQPSPMDSFATAPGRFPDGVAVLRVADTGCGIADELKHRMFEPFFSTKDRNQGTGLGLAIVHAIIAEHGGWIDVQSEVGCGSTFTVMLPRTLPAASPVTTDGAIRAARRGTGVLIIEDNALVRAMLTTVLVDAGYRVFEAGDGEEGLNVFSRDASRIEAVIVDIDLPKVNGVAVIESLLSANSALTGIAVTGYPLPPDAARRLKRRGAQLLTKPFAVNDLKQILDSALIEPGAERGR